MNVLCRIAYVLALAFVVSTNVFCKPSLLILKGMTSTIQSPTIGIKKEYSEYSPAIGALYWFSPFLKNIYEYGSDNWAFTQLVKQMFNINIDGSFDITNSYTRVANYFTTKTLGKLLGLIDECMSTIKNNPDDVQEALNNLKIRIDEKILTPLIASKTEEIKAEIIKNSQKPIERYERQISEIKAKIKVIKSQYPGKKGTELTTLQQQATKHTARVQELTGKKGKLKELTDKEAREAGIFNEEFTRDRKSISANIAQALKEELIKAYPHGTVVNSLLAFLWKKAQNRNDLRTYLNSFAAILSQQRQEIYNWPDTMTGYTEKDCLDLKNISSFSPDVPLEDLITARFAWEEYFSPFPQKIGLYAKTVYNNIEFPDCGEITLLNFFNMFCYNPKTQKFDTDFFEKLGFVHTERPDIYSFYSKYNKFDITREKIETPQAHNDWAEVVSNLPGVIYSQVICDIRPGKANLSAVIKQLCPGIESFEDFATEINKKFNDIHVEVREEVKFDRRLVTFDITKDKKAFKITLVFTSGHFDIEFPTGGIKEFINIKNSLEKRERTLPETIIYISTINQEIETDIDSIIRLPDLGPIPFFFINYPHDGIKRYAITNLSKNKGNIDVIDKLLNSMSPTSDVWPWRQSLTKVISNLLNTEKPSEILNFFNKQKNPGTLALIISYLISHDMPYKELYSWQIDKSILKAAGPEVVKLADAILSAKIPDDPAAYKFLENLFSIEIDPQQIALDSPEGRIFFAKFLELLQNIGLDPEYPYPFLETKLMQTLYGLNIPDLTQVGSATLNSILLMRGPDKALSETEKEFLTRLYNKLIPQRDNILQSGRIANSLVKTVATLKVTDEPRKNELLEKLSQSLLSERAINNMSLGWTMSTILKINFSTIEPWQKNFIDTLSTNIVRQLESASAPETIGQIINPVNIGVNDSQKKESINTIYKLLISKDYLQVNGALFAVILKTTVMGDLSHLENEPEEFVVLLFNTLKTPGLLENIIQKMTGSDISALIDIIVKTDYTKISSEKKALLKLLAEYLTHRGLL